jgi:hypothetical protein
MGASMSALNPGHPNSLDSGVGTEVKVRCAAQGNEPKVLTDIYRSANNIVIWRRTLSETLKTSVDSFLDSNASYQASMTVTPESALSSLNDALGDRGKTELSEDIAELVDMFCYLFELRRVGLRLTALDSAMCPKFHVDKVPCRLITTVHGAATEWLPHQAVNRHKLGIGSQGKPDNESGLYQNQHDIQQLNCGDVALLKGELWEGNENAGLVHRSPALAANERRLLLTLDFSD